MSTGSGGGNRSSDRDSLARKVCNQIMELEDAYIQAKREVAFYERVMRQIALMNGGAVLIDPAFGVEAINFAGECYRDAQGFHLVAHDDARHSSNVLTSRPRHHRSNLLKHADNRQSDLVVAFTNIDLTKRVACHVCLNVTTSYVSRHDPQPICCMACKTPRQILPLTDTNPETT